VKHLVRLLTITAAVACISGLSPAHATIPPPVQTPTAELTRADWSIGQKMVVRGAGWPKGKVSVQVCGNLAVNGTADCDGPGTRSFGIGANGSFGGRIVVGAPPAPCPCAVMVASNFAANVVLIPITIKDHPIQAGTPTADPNAGLTTLSITSSFVRGDWWRDALGISPTRIMTITITNTGARTSGAGVVDITVGKDSPPTGFAASISFDPIDPGESTSVAAKFAVDSFAYGTYNMLARVTSPAAGGEITEQTSTFPGYLLVGLIVIVLIIDLIWMARVRKRRQMFLDAEAEAVEAQERIAQEYARSAAAAEATTSQLAAREADHSAAIELAAAEAAEAFMALIASENSGPGSVQVEPSSGEVETEPDHLWAPPPPLD
jgi:hypothetical protein